MKQLYTFIIFATLGIATAQAEWAPTPLSWIEGFGTSESPYLVSNVTHLSELSREVAEGETFAEAIFKLVNDIDCEGADISAIGVLDKYTLEGEERDDSRYFLGTFLGNYHMIDNFVLTDAHVPDDNKVSIGGTGVFACTTEGTWIDGLIIGEKATINGGLVTGGIVGQMNGGCLSNCMMAGTVNAAEYSGGIVGVMEGGEVVGCIHTGTMTGTTDIGGIVGQQAGKSVVKVCYNNGSVTASGFGGGGITGAMYDMASMQQCYNIGEIQGESNPWLGQPDGLTADKGLNNNITDCYNVSELSGVETRYGENITSEELKALPAGLSPLLEDLQPIYGNVFFEKDTENLNDGFPVVNWENIANKSGITTIESSMGYALRYYDLNGREIKTPAQGIIVIERNGNNTRKVIF